MAVVTNNISGSKFDASRIGITGSVIVSNDPIFPTFPGTDVVFFVSGSSDGTNKSSFGGDLVVTGSLNVQGETFVSGDIVEITGSLSVTQGISGSLTQLVDGTSYLIAGSGINITSASNGAITIDSAGASPGGGDTEIQYNGSGAFTGSNNFTFNGTSLNLTGSFHTSGSVTQGPSTFATGEDSFAHGLGDPNNYGDLTASGNYSHAEGESTTASGIASHSEGQATTASGDYSHTEGFLTNATAQFSHAEGSGTTAGGFCSHAEGVGTTTTANFTHAEGNSSSATQEYAHAEGVQTTASGYGSHSEGDNTIASGDRSHAEGQGTYAYGASAHAEGTNTFAGYLGFAFTDITAGVITLDSSYSDITSEFSGYNYILLNWTNGNDVPFEVSSVVFSSPNTIVTLIDTSITDPRPGTLGIRGSVAPTGADMISDSCHSEGYGTFAQGRYSHTEGLNSRALAIGAHAEGRDTNALGIFSHAEGLQTIASGSHQHVGGKYNVRGNDFSLFVIGNGTSDADVDRSDVLRVNSGSIGDGRVEVTGSLAATTGLSGSLTQLVDGTSYLIAGNNITITSASNGAVTIDATGGSASYQLNIFAGTISSTAASASMESIGMDYFDISKVPGGATSYVFKAILATTAGTTAYMDLYDYNGIVSGTPGPISGSVLTGSNQSYTYLTADITTALSAVTGSGIIEARIWCDPTGLNLNAISKNAKLEIA